MTTTAPAVAAGTSPKRAAAVLTALILAAAVANLPLAVANVALPAIAQALPAPPTHKTPHHALPRQVKVYFTRHVAAARRCAACRRGRHFEQ